MASSHSLTSGSAVRPYRPQDEPGVRELIEAARLFASFGFTLVDELWTYQYRHRRAHAVGHVSPRQP